MSLIYSHVYYFPLFLPLSLDVKYIMFMCSESSKTNGFFVVLCVNVYLLSVQHPANTKPTKTHCQVSPLYQLGHALENFFFFSHFIFFAQTKLQ